VEKTDLQVLFLPPLLCAFNPSFWVW